MGQTYGKCCIEYVYALDDPSIHKLIHKIEDEFDLYRQDTWKPIGNSGKVTLTLSGTKKNCIAMVWYVTTHMTQHPAQLRASEVVEGNE